MFVVIFKAQLKNLDAETQGDYLKTAERLRLLALEQYHCLNFVSANEAGQEIALSYWRNLEDVKAWKQAPEHVAAQTQGRQQWYHTYCVEVLELQRQYHWAAENQERS